MILRRILTSLVITVGLVMTLGMPAYAATTPDPTNAPTTGNPEGPNTVDIRPLPNITADSSKLQTILGIVFGVIGALSLLIITIAGFRYITSNGDPQKASAAKNTIIYALVGLVVSISAVTIVTFVLGRA